MRRHVLILLVLCLAAGAAAQVTLGPEIKFKLEDTNVDITTPDNASFEAENVTVHNDTLEMGAKNFSFTQYRNGSYAPLDIDLVGYNFSIQKYPHTLMQFQLNSNYDGEDFTFIEMTDLPDLPAATVDSEPVYRLTDGSDTTQVYEGDLTRNQSYEGGQALTLEAGIPGSFDEEQSLEEEEEQQQEEQQDEETSTGGGGGGGGGGFTDEEAQNITKTLEELKEELGDPSEYIDFSSSSIDADLEPGETRTVSVSMVNNLNRSQEFDISATSNVASYLDFDESVTIPEGESRDVQVEIVIPSTDRPKSVSGSLDFSSELVEETSIPVNLNVLPPDSDSLSLELEPLFDTIAPGDTARIEASLDKEGYTDEINVTTTVDLRDPENGRVLTSKTVTVTVGNSRKDIIEIKVPENASYKNYEISGSSSFSALNETSTARDVETVSVQKPLLEREVAGIKARNLALGGLLMLILGTGGYYGYRYRQAIIAKKRRYDENIDMSTIPEGGKNQAYIGQIAERGKRTFVEMDDLKTHAMVAGATGSGKTVTGQVIAEEALKEGKNIIVLDPTAQWTGFLRENSDEGMFSKYDKFDMSKSDAQAFNGNIRAVEPGESIDITPYLNPDSDIDGQIIVFSLHKLDSKNIDKFVNETIQQVFDANLPEQNHLETMIVYDEVHRLLEEFGGSGQGLKQVERGAREFRKWGIGMLLMSQVISDFPHEVRTNIGTTVQMRTEDENDLDRMKDKFGMDTVKSIAKAEIGSGMLQNPDYNHGRPYFIDFRPLLHSPHRLSDSELEKYEQYNKMIDLLEKKVKKMKSSGKDTYELESEIQLARKNLKKGSFNLVETYIDELKQELQ